MNTVEAKWISFNRQEPFERYYFLQEQKVEADDRFFNPGWFDNE